MTPKYIDFSKVAWYAKRAKAAYLDEAQIRAELPDVKHVIMLDKIDVQYFIEEPSDSQAIVVSIRGTANKENALQDAEYLQRKNKKLGIYLHDGFDDDSDILYASLKPYLDKSRPIIVTGHSLGAAISTVIMMHLHEDGYEVADSINFGQPKVTNTKGVEKYQFLPLVRVVDENDVVPLVPCITLLDSIHGRYQHLGQQVILLKEQYFVYFSKEEAAEQSVGSFWKDLGDMSVTQHFMEHYLANIEPKLEKQQQVPYADRERYIST